MAGQDTDDYDDGQDSSPTPWYNRTPNVIGASVAGIAVVGVLIAALTFVARQFNDSPQAPLNYVEPTFSATAPRSSTPTTTATITSTSPPVTSDINGPSPTTTPTSSETPSSSDTPSTTRTAWTAPPPGWDQDESAPSTTRRGPRTNVTRTLYPQP
jgi:hypothetical protein